MVSPDVFRLKGSVMFANEIFGTLSESEARVLHGTHWRTYTTPRWEEGKRLDFQQISSDAKKSQTLLGIVGNMILEIVADTTLHESYTTAARMVRRRFGVDGGQPGSLLEIGKHFGYSVEGTRTSIAKVLRKLRHPQYSKPLRNFYEKNAIMVGGLDVRPERIKP